MKKLLPILLCIVGIIIACNQEDAFDYNYNYIPTLVISEDAIINDSISIAIDVAPINIVEGVTYQVKFDLIDDGIFLDKETKQKIVFNEYHDMKTINEKYLFIPTKLGSTKLSFSVKNVFDEIVSGESEINVAHLPFSVKGSIGTNLLSINNSLDVNLSVTQEAKNDNISYFISYGLGHTNVGGGNLLNKSLDTVTTFEVGKEVSIEKGNTPLSFNTNDVGAKNIVFYIRDSNNQQVKDSIQFDVSSIPFNVAVANTEDDVYLQEDAFIDLSLTTESDSEGIDYFLNYAYKEGDGTIYSDGAILDPLINLKLIDKDIKLTYKSSKLENNNIVFYVVDSNQMRDSVTVYLKSKNLDLTFDANATNSNIKLGEETTIKFNLIENDAYTNASYEYSYYIKGGDANLYKENQRIEPSIYHELLKGETVFKFVPLTSGEYEIVILLRDSNEQIIENVVVVEVEKVDFEFSASFVPC
jgi:hypothetical protein